MTEEMLAKAILTVQTIAEQREYNYRRTLARRLRTIEDARAFVQETGFCLFAACNGVEMPNFFHAIAGRTREVPDEHHDPDVGKWWGWKDDSLDKRWWYYGKLIRKRATLVSLDLLPYFYACSENYGDLYHDYLDEYKDGRLSVEAKSIYEALLENGPLHTIDLRQKAHMANDSAKYRFEKTLTELQAGLKILPVGIAAAGAWKYAFIYDIVARYYPDLSAQARPLTRRAAQQTLITKHLDNVVAASRSDVFRTLDVLNWTRGEFDQSVGAMIAAEQICEVQVQSGKGTYLIPKWAVDANQ